MNMKRLKRHSETYGILLRNFMNHFAIIRRIYGFASISPRSRRGSRTISGIGFLSRLSANFD